MVEPKLAQGTYEVLQNRLLDGAKLLRSRLTRLHEERASVFGNIQTRLLSTIHVTTEHNCIPRDLMTVGEHVLLGCNVQFGLKTEILPSDIFSSYRYDGEYAAAETLEPLNDGRFQRDFAELVRYYKNASFLRFYQAPPFFYMVFQTGRTIQNFKAFKWIIKEDTIEYVDNRSESEIRATNQFSFQWKRATRDQHRQGKYPHISIEDKLFVECIQGDLTIKIEDNTEQGHGIYNEPVENADQTLDDAETFYAIFDNLILLRIRPYQERDFRYLVFSVKRQTVQRLDGIGASCVFLPDDQGIIYPNGYVLQSGEGKSFEHGIVPLHFDSLTRSPNGEDFLYLFTQPETGIDVQLRYNLIRQEVDTPLLSHGQALMANGTMLTMRTEGQPQKHHALQVWETPFTSPDFRPAIQSDSFLFKIGNQDLVRGMAACQEIVNLSERDESYVGLYSDIAKSASDVLDAYFWLNKDEVFDLASPLTQIRDAANAAVEEFDKVVRVRQETENALTKAQSDVDALLREMDRQRIDTVEQFVEGLASVRSQRGEVISLKERRYIDLEAVEKLETQLIEFAERFGRRCVEFLLNAESLKAYQTNLIDLNKTAQGVKTAADGRRLEAQYNAIGEALELLIETVAQLKIDDTTQRTEIVDRISDVLAELNRDRSALRAHLRDVVHRELDADYASQSKLLEQAMSGAIESADTPEKVDSALTRILVQVEELEGRYADSDELLIRLTEKRQHIADIFESKRVQLVEARNKRANSLVLAADRLLTGIVSKANRIEDPQELRSYFASDVMVEKVRQIAEQLNALGDTVRQDDVLSRLRSVSDDAGRQQRDRQELLGDGNGTIKLGAHSFSINQQPTELTTLIRDGKLHVHITGTQFFEPISDEKLAEFEDLWDQALPSETSDVYRGETLALLLRRLEKANNFEQLSEAEQVELVRNFMQSRFQDGYSRGVHDKDAIKILKLLLKCERELGGLRFAPELRAISLFLWHFLLDEGNGKRFTEWANANREVDKILNKSIDTSELRQAIRSSIEPIYEALLSTRGFEIPISGNLEHVLDVSSSFLAEWLCEEKHGPSASPEALYLLRRLLKSLNQNQILSLQNVIRSQSLGPIDQWNIAHRISNSFWQSEKPWIESEHISERFRTELTWQILLRFAVEDHTDKLTFQDLRGDDLSGASELLRRTRDEVIDGILGDHPRIENGKLKFQYHDFVERVGLQIDHHAPRWFEFQRLKQQYASNADKKIRTKELRAKVLTSFVRNTLIDTVYLPRIGENLAKQIGASGANKRTDRMGLLLLISPPGYGKTTLMEYVANRLGLVFVKINGPAIGHNVTSLDPAEATNAAAREEVERINLALEMGDNTMLYLDDIQHCNVELLQKFIPLCDATRRIEGVWNGKSKTYDLRGRKFAVVMAGNPYNESGQRFQIPDMLANRADVYNLGEIIGDSQEAFELSYLENCLTSNASLLPLSRLTHADQLAVIRASRRGTTKEIKLEGNVNSDTLQEMLSVLQKLNRVQSAVLAVNREYIRSAAQADEYRVEPPFKLQGSYRNMNRIAEKVVPVMNDAELQRLVHSSYEQDSQTLSKDGESNMLKFKHLMGIQSPEESQRWKSICENFAQRTKLKGLSDDQTTAQVLASMSGIESGILSIGGALANVGVQAEHFIQATQQESTKSANLEVDPKIIVRHAVPRVMSDLIQSQYQLLYDGLRPVLSEIVAQRQSNTRLNEVMEECLRHYRKFAEQGLKTPVENSPDNLPDNPPAD